MSGQVRSVLTNGIQPRQADIASHEVQGPRNRVWSDTNTVAATANGLVGFDCTRATAEDTIEEKTRSESRVKSGERDVNT